MKGFQRVSTFLGQISIQHKWLVWLVCSLIAIIIASGALRLVPASDYRVFFTEDNPQRLAYEAINESFTRNDNILLVIQPADGKVFSHEFLTLIHNITTELWTYPYVIRVDSLSNFQHSYAEQDDLIVNDLFDPELHTSDDMQQIQKVALNEPQLLNRLINNTADITAINISVLLPGKNPMTETPEIVNRIRQLATQLEHNNPQLKTYLTGVIMLNNAFAEASMVDISTLIPSVFLLVFIILFIILRNGISLLIIGIVMIYSIITAMGLAGWVGYPMTPPMAIVPVIIMTLAVANTVHLLLPALKSMHKGMDKHMAIIDSIKDNAYAVFLTSLSTALGFLSLNATEVIPFHHLGNSAATGVMLTLLLSLILLPALVAIFPLTVQPDKKPRINMAPLAEFVIRQHNPVLIICLLSTLILASFVSQNEINENLIEYFDQEIQFRQDSDYVGKHLTGTGFIDYSLNTIELGVSEPDYLQDVDQFSNWLKQQPQIVNVSSVTDRFKQLNQNMHNDRIEWYSLPDRRDLAAQYLLLYEMSLPYGLDLNNQINLQKSASRITATVNNISAKDYIDLDKRATQWLQQNTPSLATIGTGPTMMFSHISMNNARSMLQSTVIALAGISVILFIALGSHKTGMLSLLPNLLPVITAFGIWGLLNGEIGLGLSLVAATSLGIIVDDTVHFLSKYHEARSTLMMTVEDAIRYTYERVGAALMTTSIALILGFLVLSFSVFKLNSDMGLLTAITLGIALILDLLMLPALLLKFSGKLKGADIRSKPAI